MSGVFVPLACPLTSAEVEVPRERQTVQDAEPQAEVPKAEQNAFPNALSAHAVQSEGSPVHPPGLLSDLGCDVDAVSLESDTGKDGPLTRCRSGTGGW